MGKGSAGTIVFSHGNSFPAGSYSLLLDAWRDADYTVHAVDKYGHDPRYPVSNHWPRLRDQLVHFVQERSDRPVYLVGHSLGGFLSLLAAARRPEIAQGVVLLDSPLVGGLLGQAVRFAKATGLGARYSPGHVSKRRRHQWPSPDAALKHFSGKPAFARWHPQMLADYIAHGIEPSTRPDVSGHTLAFRREIETQIYNTLPHDIPLFLKRHPLRCPVAFVGGTQSVEIRQVGLKITEQVTKGRISWIDGSHLYPFEQPEKTVSEVLRWLQVLANTPSS